MSLRAALAVVLLSASVACTLDHPIGIEGAGGSGPTPCGSGGGAGAPTSPIEECQVGGSTTCNSPDEHCVAKPGESCQGGPCQGWCLPTSSSAALVCAGGTNIACPLGMACVVDPYAGCEPQLICCQGVCFGVDLQPVGAAVTSCAGPACAAQEHCVGDPAASCEYDGGPECAGVCVPATQPSAIACGAYPDFACAAGLHCLKNPNHDCVLPLDCAGLCVPD